eukprot:10705698-Alexandrium_andersonii.AAC.1
MSASLVGSEMCIRDRAGLPPGWRRRGPPPWLRPSWPFLDLMARNDVPAGVPATPLPGGLVTARRLGPWSCATSSTA